MQEQYIARRAALRPERRALGLDHRLVRGGEDGAVQLGKSQVARLIHHDLDTERFIQAEDRPGLHGPRRVVLSGDHHDRRVRQARAQPVQLPEQEQDRRIGGPDGMEDVARQHDEVGPLHQEVVHRAAERLGYVRLALIPAPGRLPVVLAEAEVEIGEVSELHALSWCP